MVTNWSMHLLSYFTPTSLVHSDSKQEHALTSVWNDSYAYAQLLWPLRKGSYLVFARGEGVAATIVHRAQGDWAAGCVAGAAVAEWARAAQGPAPFVKVDANRAIVAAAVIHLPACAHGP
eukprot:6358676-Pyramimonas_sp.AAC.1